MRLIRKGREPLSLTAYREVEGASYKNCPTDCKDDIRETLLKEQGHLCAYCMRRIRWVKNGSGVTGEEIKRRDMKIEHWFPEKLLDDKGTLDFQNMLGVCNGRHTDETEDTCDTKKGGNLLTVDPRRQEHIDLIRYDINDSNQKVIIKSDDTKIDSDLNERLNLNGNVLPFGRWGALDAILEKIQGLRAAGKFSAAILKKIRDSYERPDENEQMKEYSGFILWYFDHNTKAAQTKP